MDVALTDGPVEIVGALDLDRTDTGISPRRLPGVDPSADPGPLHGVHGHARFRRADRVPHRRAVDRARRHAHRLRGDGHAAADRRVRPRGRRRARRPARRSTSGRASCWTSRRSTCRCAPAPAGTVRFDELGDAMKSVELWLPQSAASELRALRVPDGARVEAPRAPATAVGALRQLDQPLRRGARSHRRVARGRGAARRRRAPPARVRRAVPARPVRGPHDRAAGRRPDQPQGRHQRGEREQPHGADVPERAARLPRHGARAPPRRAAARGVADRLPDGRDPSRPDGPRRRRRVPGRRRRPARAARHRPHARSGSARSWREVVAGRRERGDARLHHLDGLELFGPDDVGDLPDGLHPNGDGYVRMGERFAAHAFAPGGPFAA